MPTFYECVQQKFNQIKGERRYLWILAGMKDLRERAGIKSLYPDCVKIMKQCDQCQPFIPYYIMEEIFGNCSQKAFRNVGVQTSMKKKLPRNELENLSMQKIGLMATSKAAQNLTYNDIENMKFVAANNPELEKFLCTYESKSLSLDNPDPTHRWFTLDEYEGMKVLLEENEYFRWSFCTGISAISSTSKLVCFPSRYRHCGDVLRNLPPYDSYESLQQCRKIAKAQDFHHSAICN
uniref:Uncharacterized protein n=1 Tax=Panagrolaimus sp. PS1159 TaxID=55785 RepID=A0AC35FIK1_9BILA